MQFSVTVCFYFFLEHKNVNLQYIYMKKILLFLSFLLMSIGVWGVDATFRPSDFTGQGTSGTGSPISATVNTITFACNKGYGTTQIRCYSGSKITISSTNTITAITFTFSGSYKGGLNTSYTGLNTTSWEQTLSSQARITQLVVTYNNAIQILYSTTFKNYLGVDSIKTQTTEGSSITLPTTMPICNDCYGDNWTIAYWMLSNGTRINSSSHTPIKNDTLYPMYWRMSDSVEEVEEYKKVTRDLSPNWEGDYLIAYSSTVFADGRVGGTEDVGAIGKNGTMVTPIDEINIIDDSIVTKEWGDIYNVSIEEISENSNTYLLKTKDGKYNYQTSNNNGVASTNNRSTATNYPLTITFNSSGDVDIAAPAGAIFHYNADQSGFFRFYKNGGQNPIYLYRKQTSLKPVGTEYSTSPECDSSFITTWNKDKVFIDKGLSYDLDGKTVTIKDIDTDETLSNSITYDSSTDLYQVNTNLTGKECDKINIFITDNNTDSIYLIYKVPFIVDADAYTTSMDDENCDVVVLPGKKLTVSGTESEHRDVKLYGGAHLSIPSGTEYTINSLSLRRDNLTPSTVQVVGRLNTNKLYFDLYVDAAEWYFVCLPNTFILTDLKYTNGRIPQYKKNYWLRYYDGEGRAYTQSGAWRNVDHDKTFALGEGFIFGLNDDLKKKEFRFELPVSTLTDETSNKSVGNLHAWGGNVAELRPNHKGWNLIGNPFMNSVVTDLASPIRIDSLVKVMNGDQWTGQWKLSNSDRGKQFRYGVFPSKDEEDAPAGYYKSVVLDDITLSPFTSFFVQIGGEDPETNEAIIFNTSDRGPLYAPKRYAASEDEELFLRVKVDNRKTGMFISNKFTDEYEPGDDLESRYPIYQSIGGYKLLYSAINDSIIEHGVQVTAPQGTLYLDPKVDVNKFEYIYANYNNNWYDLKSETVEVNGTFIIQAKRKSNDTPTDIQTPTGTFAPMKYIDNNGHVYFRHNGFVYTMDGKLIKK